jgi:hypothetical protein
MYSLIKQTEQSGHVLKILHCGGIAIQIHRGLRAGQERSHGWDAPWSRPWPGWGHIGAGGGCWLCD